LHWHSPQKNEGHIFMSSFLDFLSGSINPCVCLLANTTFSGTLKTLKIMQFCRITKPVRMLLCYRESFILSKHPLLFNVNYAQFYLKTTTPRLKWMHQNEAFQKFSHMLRTYQLTTRLRSHCPDPSLSFQLCGVHLRLRVTLHPQTPSTYKKLRLCNTFWLICIELVFDKAIRKSGLKVKVLVWFGLVLRQGLIM
jgi:hypothetical protein